MNSLAHIEINVSNLKTSKDFYSKILTKLNWKMIHEDTNSIGFKGEDNTHLFLTQTSKSFVFNIFHRKNTGLNHLAFRISSKNGVDAFNNFLKNNHIKPLYSDDPRDYSKEYDMKEYYAVFFEDPDRIKLELVFME